MKGVRCPTGRAVISTEAEASIYAARVRKGARAVRCRYCGWWHVVGLGSPLEHPSKARHRPR